MPKHDDLLGTVYEDEPQRPEPLQRASRMVFGEDRPPCDAKTQRWIRETYSGGSSEACAKARAMRQENAKRHSRWMAKG